MIRLMQSIFYSAVLLGLAYYTTNRIADVMDSSTVATWKGRNPAYRDFRARRAKMRARDGELDPHRLVETLTAYSERRERYVRTIQKILRVDDLQELEDTQLENRPIETTQVFKR